VPEQERRFLEAVAEKLPDEEREHLLSDVQKAFVRQEGDFLLFDLPGYARPPYRGHHNLPFEGKMRAADGGAMSVLVNMDENDRLLAVEFIRWESSANVAPDWSTLTIVPEPPLGASDW
jgi:hypothetical protein